MLFISNFACFNGVLTNHNTWIYFKKKITIQSLTRDAENRPKGWYTIFRINFIHCVLYNSLLDFTNLRQPYLNLSSALRLPSRYFPVDLQNCFYSTPLWSRIATSHCLKCWFLSWLWICWISLPLLALPHLSLFWVLISSFFPLPSFYYSSFLLSSSSLSSSSSSYILWMANSCPNRPPPHK